MGTHGVLEYSRGTRQVRLSTDRSCLKWETREGGVRKLALDKVCKWESPLARPLAGLFARSFPSDGRMSLL